LIGLDVDPDALELGRKRLERFGPRVRLVQANFRTIEAAWASTGEPRPGAILMDLGVSSMQLDRPERGFSFQAEGPLDMRMDPRLGESAREWIHSKTQEELESIFREYGEERHARRIAAAIVAARSRHEIRSTRELSELVARAVGAPPPGHRRSRIHPATRVFQGLRIAVNDELAALDEGLQAAVRILEVGGRLAVITFHSLEDRLAKQIFRREEREIRRLAWINKHVLTAGDPEIGRNPRARSAKLRIVEKLKD
ncbi:MAG: 16S rRNA (cytosine(1402)-N(4))-methyltransferase RsmH, partial [Verrucomicrobiae bacterium]|nr:16S rRNA (cytosine(1402)-N(4))-methyltransferase RsmH [Verrucomicrobiae bacterium]